MPLQVVDDLFIEIEPGQEDFHGDKDSRTTARTQKSDREERSIGFRAPLAPWPFASAHPCSPKPPSTLFDVLIYASSRWLEGIIESIMS
jgi:hypothetical protein